MTPAHQAPLAQGMPVIGNTLDFLTNPAHAMAAAYKAHGPVFRIRIPGHWNRIALAGPAISQLMARDMAADKEDRALLTSRPFWADFVKEFGAQRALMAADGAEHRALQSAMRLGFHRSTLEGQYDRIDQLGQSFVETLWQPGDVAVLAAFQRQVAVEIGELTVGVSPQDHVEDIQLIVSRAINTLLTKQMPRALLSLPRYKRARATMDQLIQQVARDAQNNMHATHRNIARDVLRAQAQDPDLFPDCDLPLVLMGPFFAGLETEASTLSALVYELARHPHIQERALADAHDIHNANDKKQALTQATFLKSCIIEAMRLWPISPLLMRTTTRDLTFEGFHVPGGETIFVGITVPHFVDQIYPNPFDFDPDRKQSPRYFGAFGGGTHICLGRTLALDHMMLTISRLLVARKLELVHPNYRLKLKPLPTPGPDWSFKLRVSNR